MDGKNKKLLPRFFFSKSVSYNQKNDAIKMIFHISHLFSLSDFINCAHFASQNKILLTASTAVPHVTWKADNILLPSFSVIKILG